MANPLIAPAISFLDRLKHPTLFKLAALLFAIDLVVPDMIPFADEILLAIGTLFLGKWKRRHEDASIESRR